MLTALPVIVGSEWVTGVMAPMTPKGACSITARPWSPLKTSLRRNSTPRRALAQGLELFDLVLQPADLGLFHLHRAQLDALVDRDAADVVDDAAAIVERHGGEALEGLAGGRHGGVDRGEQAAIGLAGRWTPRRRRAAGPSRASTCSTTLRIRVSSICTVSPLMVG